MIVTLASSGPKRQSAALAVGMGEFANGAGVMEPTTVQPGSFASAMTGAAVGSSIVLEVGVSGGVVGEGGTTSVAVWQAVKASKMRTNKWVGEGLSIIIS